MSCLRMTNLYNDFVKEGFTSILKETTMEATKNLAFLTSIQVRNDANIERYPAIWRTPQQPKSELKGRTISRFTPLKDNSTILSQIRISPNVDYGNLTTEDQKVFYGLIRLWDEAGRPSELVFSLRQLARALNVSWNDELGESLKRSLWRLRSTMFAWLNAYCDGETKEYYKEIKSFTILAELEIAEKGKNGHTTTQSCKAKFYPLIEKSLRNNYVQPAFYNVLINFKSSVAQLLYQYLELKMYKHTNFERNSEALFLDLGIEGKVYKYKSSRERILRRAITEVDKLPIPNGVLYLSLELTRDKTDWKIIVKKSPQQLLEFKDQLGADEDLGVIRTEEIKLKSEKDKSEEEPTLEGSLINPNNLVMFFLERFGIRRNRPTDKELEHAQRVITQYKMTPEQGTHFIDFAKRKSVETNFDEKLKNFGAIIQYLDEAFVSYSEDSKKKAARIVREECQFCDSVGYIRVFKQDNTVAMLRCFHDLEKIKAVAEKDRVRIELRNGEIVTP